MARWWTRSLHWLVETVLHQKLVIRLAFHPKGYWHFCCPLISEDSANGGFAVTVSFVKLALVTDSLMAAGKVRASLAFRPSVVLTILFEAYVPFPLVLSQKASSHHQVIYREELALTAITGVLIFAFLLPWGSGDKTWWLWWQRCGALFAALSSALYSGKRSAGFLLCREQTFGKLHSSPHIWDSWMTCCCPHWQNNTVESGESTGWQLFLLSSSPLFQKRNCWSLLGWAVWLVGGRAGSGSQPGWGGCRSEVKEP